MLPSISSFCFFLFSYLFQTKTTLFFSFSFFIFGERQKSHAKYMTVVFWWNIVEKLIKIQDVCQGAAWALSLDGRPPCHLGNLIKNLICLLGGCLGLKPRSPPFCVKLGGGQSLGAVQAFDTGPTCRSERKETFCKSVWKFLLFSMSKMKFIRHIHLMIESIHSETKSTHAKMYAHSRTSHVFVVTIIYKHLQLSF